MSHPVNGIDHVVFLVSDLDAAAKRFERLGFCLSPRGTHSPHMGTGNYTIIFPHDYFELLGVIAETPHNANKRKTLAARGDGLTAIACRIGDVHATRAALERLGIATTEVKDFSRPLPLPDGSTGVAAFSISAFAADEVPVGEVFMCNHKTRNMVWRPELMAHKNGAQALHGIVVAADVPQTTAQGFARLFAAGHIDEQADGFCVRTGDESATIFCATPQALATRYVGVDMAALQGDFAALQIAVADLATTRSYLDAAGVSYRDIPDCGSIFVSPDDARGNVLEFIER